MNFLDVTVGTLAAATASASHDDGSLTSRAAAPVPRRHPARVVRAGYPTGARSVSDGGDQNAVPATVDVLEPIGSDNYLYLDLGESRPDSRAMARRIHRQGQHRR